MIAEDEDLLSAVEDPEQKARSLRLQGLGLVLLVMLADRLVLALEWWAAEPSRTRSIDADPTLWALGGIVESLSLLCLLAYVLFRQGRSLRQLGVTARWSDLPLGLGLAALIHLPHAIDDLAMHGALRSSLVSGLGVERVTLVGLVHLLCFAAERELILRAYVMTEVGAFTSSAVLAVAASLGLQELYNPLFRTPTVLSVLIRCLYYWKTRRATPLVLGDFAAGLWVMLHAAAGS